MQILVDSGSTKTTWSIMLPAVNGFQFHTEGINPVRDNVETIRDVVAKAYSAIDAEFLCGHASSLVGSNSFEQVHFYGAGCTPAFSPIVADVLRAFFPSAVIKVDSDMLGAARALCQHEAGIACILGTGANSCLYDGANIVKQVSPLGWILGDEGSGAVLGRTLLSDVLKGQLPEHIIEAFQERYHLDAAAAIENVYRSPQPNRWLASFVPFIAEHREEESLQLLLSSQFRAFFRRNLKSYNCEGLPVHFVGSIAWYFKSELLAAAVAEGFSIGRVLRNPIEGLEKYHRSK
ncbi:MAG: ATPase [Bacteroidaceae bacterium]|nr:ATPase [Bacteroidaceae bacterium]